VTAVADKLREARALIERGWTQGANARDEMGDRLFVDTDEAVCFCMMGAIIAAVPPDQLLAAEHLLKRAVNDEGVEYWNDAPERTQSEVLAAFDKAIELAEAGQ
jgi:hypothetical protein